MSNQDSNSNSASGSGSGSGSDNDTNDGEVHVAEPLATTRARRTNAGNLMSKMIQDEEDEFYSNLYGGFHEEDDDMDFDDEEDANNEEVEDDYDVDSDFSIDETDEIAPEHQMVDEEPKKRRGAYKDPKPKGHSSTTVPSSTGVAGSSTAGMPSTTTPKIKPSHSPGKNRAERSFRDSTRKKTEETIKNIQTGTRKKKKKKLRNEEAWRTMTQEEMLAEAKLTEEENLKSLETYQKIELEKLKKIKPVKKTLPVPYVSFTSTTFPVVKKDPITGKKVETNERYTRNLLNFVT